jgi:putative ABC transport system ATP-binding protein
MELLKELHQEGSPVLMVTHDPRFAEFADRTIHLFDGRVVEDPRRESENIWGRRIGHFADIAVR